MKLQFEDSSEQEEDRPSCLTLNFFSSLMATDCKRKGIFQILTFSKKRERVYSTRLNDGYFSVKVMVVNEAALQIETGAIQQLYILEGYLRNHGEGVIVMKEAVKTWKYSKEIGSPASWRLKKENVNFKGSNFIVWSSQKKEEIVSQIPPLYGVEESQVKSDKTISPVKEKSMKKEVSKSHQKKGKDMSQIKPQKILRLSQECIEPALQTQPEVEAEPQKPITPLKQSNQQRFQSIMNLFFTEDSSEEEQQKPQAPPSKKSEIKPSSSKKKILERKEDLQFIFNFLSDEQEEKAEQKVETNCVLPEGILDSVSKRCSNSGSSDNDYDLIEWIIKKKQLQQEQNTKISSKEKSMKEQEKPSKAKAPTCFEEVYYGYIKNCKQWEVAAIIKCLIEQPSQTICIICDEDHRFPIYVYFTNIGQNTKSIKQGHLYRLGGGTIIPSHMHPLNLSNIEISFDCKTCLIEQLDPNPKEAIEPSENYTPIQRIYLIQEGLIINCYGIIKDVKVFKGKNGSTVNIELADPITKWSITIVQFDIKGNTEALKGNIGHFLTIYGGCVGSYKGKKNIVKKLNTIIKHDFIPLTKEAREVRKWAESNNSVSNLETELVGYTEISDLRSIEEQAGTNFFLKSVIVFEFKSKFTYRACRTCMKKVEDGRCRNCGVRRPSDIDEERLFLRGQIGDMTTSANVIWSNSSAESLLVSGFEELKKRWLLRKVSVWIDKGANGSLSIVRMKMRESKEQLQAKIKEVRACLLQDT